MEDEYELVPEQDGVYLFVYDQYPESSVLAGQFRATRMARYDTLEEAEKAHPHISVRRDGTCPFVGCAVVPDVPPDGFDPAGS